MLMEEFKKWRTNPNNLSPYADEDSEDNFSIFYQHHCVGKGFMLMLCDLAYQVYELQEIVEGLIEDLER